jgi:hypothetical protein
VSPAPSAVDEAPDTSHLSIAELGAILSESTAVPTSLEVTLDPDWELAAAGEDLAPRQPAPAPAVDLDRIHFDVAPVGADLGQKAAEPAPPPPDTSRFKLV